MRAHRHERRGAIIFSAVTGRSFITAVWKSGTISYYTSYRFTQNADRVEQTIVKFHTEVTPAAQRKEVSQDVKRETTGRTIQYRAHARRINESRAGEGAHIAGLQAHLMAAHLPRAPFSPRHAELPRRNGSSEMTCADASTGAPPIHTAHRDAMK